MVPRALLILLLGIAFSSLPAHASDQYIDDTSSAWSFDPIDVFGSVSAEHRCDHCVSSPDPTRVYQGTWRDCVEQGTAKLEFNGVGVTIYTICPGGHPGGAYVGNFTIELDGVAQRPFEETSGGCTDYKYNYPIFSTTKLANGVHTVSITNTGTHEGSTSNLLLDYAVVDLGSGSPVPGNEDNKGNLPVIAIVIPVLVVVILTIVGVIFLVLRRRRKQRDPRLDGAAPSPYKEIGGPDDDIAMTVYVPGQGDPATRALAQVQATGRDPELEAALRVLASRSRQNAQETTQSMHLVSDPVSPAYTTGWTRDRKVPHRSDSNATGSTPISSRTRSGTLSTEPDPIPPAYQNPLRRLYP